MFFIFERSCFVRYWTWGINTGIVSEPIEAHAPIAALDIIFLTFIDIFACSVVAGNPIAAWTRALVTTSQIRTSVLTNKFRIALVYV